MYSLIIHEDAKQDLEELWGTPDNQAAALITAFLEQAENDQDILDSMTAHKFKDEVLDVSRYQELYITGRNIWRLKLIELEALSLPYRIIYAFDPRIHRYFILGIVHRNFNYDVNNERTEKIISEYEQLDIPTY